ncbi:MAG: hypothetical protein LAT57_14400 [Balneolales bacterium]|nr:hypothetical protein [Balneolales bacterium]
MKTFRGIWYRPKPPQERTLNEAFKRKTGRLEIDRTGLSFNSKEGSLSIRNIQSVTFGLQGSDPVNTYVKITYLDSGATKVAYFADGKLFGYSGFFGGTWRIYRSLSHLIELPKITDYTHLKNKATLTFAFSILAYLIVQNIIPKYF